MTASKSAPAAKKAAEPKTSPESVDVPATPGEPVAAATVPDETAAAEESKSDAKVTVETPDPAELERERREKAEAEHAASLRAQQVAGLETELAYLERTPSPDPKRVAAVKEQISVYSEQPARTRETR